MYKKFNLSSITLDALNKKIDLKFNFDIKEASVQGDSINLVTLNTGDHITFKQFIKNNMIHLKLNEWPEPETVYQIIVEKEIENISGIKLDSAIRRKIIFSSEITSKVNIKSPYNFQKLDELFFEWDDDSDINSYYVEIAKENKFYNLIYSGEIYTNSISPVLQDLKNGQYYFRIRLQKNNQYGPWSNVVTFIYKDVCTCDDPEDPGPSADAEMPSAWDDLYSGNDSGNNSSGPETNNDISYDVEDELEVITSPTNGTTPTAFVFEFDKKLEPYIGEVIVIKREF